MKNLILPALLFISGTNWGQITYRPIPETNAVWIQTQLFTGGFHEYETNISAVYLLGDTVLNGQTYVQFGSHGLYKWVDNWGSQQNYNEGAGTLPYSTGYFRQDVSQKKVYILNTTNQTEELLYDFGSLVVGQPYPETVTNINYPNIMVLGQDSVQLLDGNYYKRWALGTNSMDSAYVSVIEGVGGTNGFNTPIYGNFEQFSRLLCHETVESIYEDWQLYPISPQFVQNCSRSLSLEEQNETNVVIYPNPTSTSLSIQSSKLIELVEIYDLNGQTLLTLENNKVDELTVNLSGLRQGVYFVRILSEDGYSVIRQIQLIN